MEPVGESAGMPATPTPSDHNAPLLCTSNVLNVLSKCRLGYVRDGRITEEATNVLMFLRLRLIFFALELVNGTQVEPDCQWQRRRLQHITLEGHLLNKVSDKLRLYEENTKCLKSQSDSFEL